MAFPKGEIKIFFACTFHDKTQRIVDKIFNNLAAVDEFNIHKWIAREPSPLIEATKKKIKSADAFVGVITRKSLWPTIEAAITKIVKPKNKKLYLFIDSTVPNKAVYRELTDNVFLFDSGNLSEISSQVDFVKEGLQKFTADYRLIRTRKRVRIFTEGHGLITYVHEQQVASRSDAFVKHLYGAFSVSKDAARRNGSAIPPVHSLVNPNSRLLGTPSFACRILNSSEADPVSIVKIVDDGVENRPILRRRFFLILDRALRPGEKLEWAWGFTFPKLFKVTGEDSSWYRPKMPIPSFSFELYFEVPHAFNPAIYFKNQPHICRIGGQQDSCSSAHSVTNSLRFTKFTWRDIIDISEGEKIIVVWDWATKKGAIALR